jgi:hypothetical protein
MAAKKTFRRLTGLAALLFALSLPGACASFGAKDEAPPWFKQRVAELKKRPYPRLVSVPQATPSSNTPEQWSALEGEVESAGAALNASPRSATADQAPAVTGEFETKARKEVDAARPER